MGFGGGSRSVSDEIGYNKGNVEQIREEINTMAKNSAEKIVSEIHDTIVAKVAELWYSEVAVKYFEEFKATLKNKETDITEVFQNFNNKMKEAGEAWAATTEGEAPEMPAIEQVDMTLDVSAIQPTNAEGDRFITDGLEGKVLSMVEDARTNIKTYIDQQTSNADASLAFFGGGQETAINEAARELDEQVDQVLNYLIEGENSIVEAVRSRNESYTSTATSNNASFSDSNFGGL